LTFFSNNLIYESRRDPHGVAQFDVKGESIDEERNQEGCEAGEEEGSCEEEEVADAS
jgi:hypothetical protein